MKKSIFVLFIIFYFTISLKYDAYGNCDTPPPCPEEVTNYSIYYGSCWNFSIPAQCPGVTYCKVTYGVCCNSGVRYARYIQTEAIGGTCQGDCVYDCP